jgi:arylsulfotransferase ASST
MFRAHKRTLQIAASAFAFGALAAAPAAAATPDIAAYTTKGAYTYVSAPRLNPPKLHTDRATSFKQLAPGDFFLANFKDLTKTQANGAPVLLTGQAGPLIVDSHLQPVWFNPIGTKEFANNLRVQTYNGKPALSWWQGVITNTGATQSGALYVVDQHYRPIGHPLRGTNGWTITQHEAIIVGHNVWVTAVKPEQMDLTSYGGAANGTVINAAVQEYDLTTGQLKYTWDAAPDGIQPGHIPLSDSYAKPSPSATVPWDAYHINSIQVGTKGFVTSMRNTWSAYSVDTLTGLTSWTLGGKHSTYSLPANGQFEWQHDVEVHPGGLVTVFNDNCCAIVGPGKLGPPNGQAVALVLRLDNANDTASLVNSYGRNLFVGFQGNAQLQPNGNMLAGWGSAPYFTEFAKSGKQVLDAVLPSPDLSYRAYLSKWVGLPTTAPSGAARNAKANKSTVYASWDGATQVTAWRVLAGRNAKSLKIVAGRAKTGFETTLPLKARYGTYKVQALDARGHVLSTSKAFSIPKANTKPAPPSFY